MVIVQTRDELLADLRRQKARPSQIKKLDRPFVFGRYILDFYRRGCWCSSLAFQLEGLDELQDVLISDELSDYLLCPQVSRLAEMIYGSLPLVWARDASVVN